MSRKLTTHTYSDRLSFERLLMLIATLLKYPGIGYMEFEEGSKTTKHHNALEEVIKALKETARMLQIELPEGYPAVATLRKDLEILKKYGLLDKRMYRWGYYLGTGVMTLDELQVIFNALESQAIYQGDPHIRKIHQNLSRRLRGLDTKEVNLSYPVRQYLNHVIEYTDPEEMMAEQQFRDTLYHQFPNLEKAIIEGQLVEISRYIDIYGDSFLGIQTVWPLQLIYHDIAWYLLYECYDNGQLIIGRVSRFKNYCRVLDSSRSLNSQREGLKKAYKLLKNGWGLKLGSLEEQKEELDSKQPYVPIQVRFYPPISYFIQEEELRHPRQKLKLGEKDPSTKKPKYVDYCINLPPRSLDEFIIWVQRYADKAQVLSPPELAERHYQKALALVERYRIG